MKVLIATKNQGKIEGATKALKRFYEDLEIRGVSVESNVCEQPVNEEIFIGAKNRIKNLKNYAKQQKIDADLYLSIESGISNLLGSWMIVNICVVEDSLGYQSVACSPGFPVPERLVDDIIKTDLSKVMDNVFSKDKERHNKGGGIQLLTHNALSRIDLTESAFIMALTSFVNGNLWK